MDTISQTEHAQITLLYSEFIPFITSIWNIVLQNQMSSNDTRLILSAKDASKRSMMTQKRDV